MGSNGRKNNSGSSSLSSNNFFSEEAIEGSAVLKSSIFEGIGLNVSEKTLKNFDDKAANNSKIADLSGSTIFGNSRDNKNDNPLLSKEIDGNRMLNKLG